MNLITNEESPKTEISAKRLHELLLTERTFNAKLEKMLDIEMRDLWEENQMLRGNIELHRVFSTILTVIVIGLCFMLWLNN